MYNAMEVNYIFRNTGRGYTVINCTCVATIVRSPAKIPTVSAK